MGIDAGTPPGLWERVRKIAAEEVAKFARSGFLRNARISGGSGLTITDGGRFTAEYADSLGGGAAVYIGDIYGQSTGVYQGTGLLVNSPEGRNMMVMRSDASFGTSMHNIFGSDGKIILGNDAASGSGLARPWLSGQFAKSRYVDFTSVTQSGTFETLFDTRVSKQHPRMEVAYRASSDVAGTTGEVRIMVNGVQFGATTTESFTINTRFIGPLPVPGEHMVDLVIEVQARRTAGTGTIRVEPIYWRARQS